MTKKLKILVILVIILLVLLVGFFWLRSRPKNNPDNPNSLGKELRKLMERSEIKQTYLAHQSSQKKRSEIVKPDNEKTELTVVYRGSFFVENSSATFKTFESVNSEKTIRIAIASENPLLSEKELKSKPHLKFRITFYGKDVKKHWTAGRKPAGGYWGDYYYSAEDNLNFQLETLPWHWENSQSLNPAFLGKWKIDLPKSIEAGFAKINSKIRKRIDEQLSREFYTEQAKYGNGSFLEIEIKKVNGLVQMKGYTIFWIKNLDDYTMACFTDYHPNHHFDILENDAVLTIFRLDQNKKNLTIFHPTIVEDVCRSVGVDGEKILGWVSYTWNLEYKRLKPYFRENARIVAAKVE